MSEYRTDLAMERTVRPGGMGDGVCVDTQKRGEMEITWVRIDSPEAAKRLGKAQGVYWTLTHPRLPALSPEDRMTVAKEVGQMLRLLLPPKGDVLVLGLAGALEAKRAIRRGILLTAFSENSAATIAAAAERHIKCLLRFFYKAKHITHTKYT